MITFTNFFSLLLGCTIFSLTLPSKASALEEPISGEVFRKSGGSSAARAYFAKNVYSLLALNELPDSGIVSLILQVNNSGELERLELDPTSKVNLLTEVACMEAFLAAGKQNWRLITGLENFAFRLNSSNQFVHLDRSYSDFYQKHPNLKEAALVHLIPLAFENQFSKTELRSFNNVASLGKDREPAIKTLKSIYELWAPFLAAPRKFSRREVINQARELQEKFDLREGALPPEDS